MCIRDSACSGYEGIGLILAFTAGWLWFFRREWRFPRALLLIPLGIAAIWVFNAVRVAGLVLIGVAGAPGIALQGLSLIHILQAAGSLLGRKARMRRKVRQEVASYA